MSDQNPKSKGSKKEPLLPTGHDFLDQINAFFHGTGGPSLLHSMDNLFQKSNPFHPSIPIDMYETEKEWVIQAELPGIDKDRLRIDAFGDKVHISVVNHMEKTIENEQQHFHRRERRFQETERVVTLPYAVSPEEIQASFQHGLLELRGKKRPKQNRSIRLD